MTGETCHCQVARFSNPPEKQLPGLVVLKEKVTLEWQGMNWNISIHSLNTGSLVIVFPSDFPQVILFVCIKHD